MNDQVIMVVLGFICSLIAIITPIIKLNSKIAQLTVMVEELEKKVDKHNEVVERMAVLERDVKTSFNRIDELREDIRDVK